MYSYRSSGSAGNTLGLDQAPGVFQGVSTDKVRAEQHFSKKLGASKKS